MRVGPRLVPRLALKDRIIASFPEPGGIARRCFRWIRRRRVDPAPRCQKIVDRKSLIGWQGPDGHAAGCLAYDQACAVGGECLGEVYR